METPDRTDNLIRSLSWKLVTTVSGYNGPGEWLYEAIYETRYGPVRVACGYNDGGPAAWVGHPTKDQWIDSTACDGSFESGARRALELAEELVSDRDEFRELLGLTK